ncbi:MAG: site-specific integrase [Nitrospirota bacterium]
MIEEYKTQRLREVIPTTINKEIGCLKHMYTKALEWGYLKRNPAKEVKLLKQPPGRLRYLEREEINNLLDACAPHLRPIIVAGLNTGMRKGEILNLKWSDVDLKNRRITLTNTKNNEIRIIPINDTFYQELINLKDNSQGEYVFCNAKKKPFSDIKKAFVSALKRAGIKDFRFHDLRHTFGSHLVMKGVDLRTVQQLLGHKDIKMTMRYSHLSPGHLQEAVVKLDKL